MARTRPQVTHTVASPFPYTSSLGGTVLDERCACGHHRSSHRDQEGGYGHGACEMRAGFGRACACQMFKHESNIRHYKRPALRVRQSSRQFQQRLNGADTLGARGTKVTVRVRSEDRNEADHTFTVAEIAVQPPSMNARRGSALGLGANPAYVIAQRIKAALDPRQVCRPARQLADMTEAERQRLAVELEAPLSPAAGTPHVPKAPPATAISSIRLGPPDANNERLLFSTTGDWRQLNAIARRLHVRREPFIEAYRLREPRWRLALAWGIREANRVEQTIALRHR